MFIDTHAHLFDEQLIEKRDEIISGMAEAKLKAIINVAYGLKSAKHVAEFAAENKNVYAAVGIHPENVDEFNDEFLAELEKLCNGLNGEKIVAIGEIGLDYHYEGYNAAKQKEAFLKQASVAARLGKPMIIHLRDAFSDFEKIICENKELFGGKILMHCYSGSGEFAKMLMKELPQVYFAFGGAITFKNAENIRLAAGVIPLNRLVCETDCPYLTPEPFRGRRVNEPGLVKYVYEKLAYTLEMLPAELEAQIEKNVRELFLI